MRFKDISPRQKLDEGRKDILAFLASFAKNPGPAAKKFIEDAVRLVRRGDDDAFRALLVKNKVMRASDDIDLADLKKLIRSAEREGIDKLPVDTPFAQRLYLMRQRENAIARADAITKGQKVTPGSGAERLRREKDGPNVIRRRPPSEEVSDLAKNNNIADPNKIQVGQEITLPNGSVYKVQSGDTLGGILQKFKNSQRIQSQLPKTDWKKLSRNIDDDKELDKWLERHEQVFGKNFITDPDSRRALKRSIQLHGAIALMLLLKSCVDEGGGDPFSTDNDNSERARRTQQQITVWLEQRPREELNDFNEALGSGNSDAIEEVETSIDNVIQSGEIDSSSSQSDSAQAVTDPKNDTLGVSDNSTDGPPVDTGAREPEQRNQEIPSQDQKIISVEPVVKEPEITVKVEPEQADSQEQIDARNKKREEEKRKAEAAAQRRAEEEAKAEAKRKAEEAKRKAEEAKRKAEAEAEAKRKAEAEAEAKRKAEAEAEAKRKAEEERKKREEEQRKAQAGSGDGIGTGTGDAQVDGAGSSATGDNNTSGGPTGTDSTDQKGGTSSDGTDTSGRRSDSGVTPGDVGSNTGTGGGDSPLPGENLEDYFRRMEKKYDYSRGGKPGTLKGLPVRESLQLQEAYTKKQYVDLVMKYSKLYDVPPELALHVLNRETGIYDADRAATIVSPKGAVGVMQLNPGLGGKFLKDLGISRKDLINPQKNIEAGVRLLAKHYNTYNQNPTYALMAYNWGPTATAQWVRKGGKGKIPQETRDYIYGNKEKNWEPYKRNLDNQIMLALGGEGTAYLDKIKAKSNTQDEVPTGAQDEAPSDIQNQSQGILNKSGGIALDRVGSYLYDKYQQFKQGITDTDPADIDQTKSAIDYANKNDPGRQGILRLGSKAADALKDIGTAIVNAPGKVKDAADATVDAVAPPKGMEDYGLDSSGKTKWDREIEKDPNLVKEETPPGKKYERMVKHIKKGYAKDGKLTDQEKSIAYATAWKLYNQSKKKKS